MRSPASRHARIESTIAWVANKVAAARRSAAARVLPDWLLQPDKPVPRTPAFEMQAISSRVHAFLLALINGERSMRDMARVLVEQRLMSAQEAEAAGAAVPRAPARRKRIAQVAAPSLPLSGTVTATICHDPSPDRPRAARCLPDPGAQ